MGNFETGGAYRGGACKLTYRNVLRHFLITLWSVHISQEKQKVEPKYPMGLEGGSQEISVKGTVAVLVDVKKIKCIKLALV